ILFYRAFLATMALMFSLFGGAAWTFGASYFAVGYLNANSAFLGSIVLGNGINFGIILLARYIEERRRGKGHARACQIAMVHTATATWTAALAAGLSYGSLMLTGFRGFRQFGTIGLIGMVLCWISAFTLLPAYLAILDRIRPLVKRGQKREPWIWDGMARLINRFAMPIWIGSLVVTLGSLALFVGFDADKIQETNLAKLRNKASMVSGSA